MTGSMSVIAVIVVAGLLYLLLRRRGTRQGEDIRAVRSSDGGRSPSEASDLKPFKAKVDDLRAGLPPKPKVSPHDSGSSHPAYPVAPAKYSGAVLGRTDPVSRSGAAGGVSGVHRAFVPTPSNPDFDPVAAAKGDPNAPPPAEPWYPEAPAPYTEDDVATGLAHRDEPEAGR